MGIRAKIILVVLPLIITTLLLTGASSFFSATNAITGVAKEFLGFKAAELEKHAASQSCAASIVRSPTEVIFALDEEGGLGMQTGELEVRPGEKAALQALAGSRKRELATPRIGGGGRGGQGLRVQPFG